MEDTVTRAKREREKEGLWEVEVSYGGEADLHKHLTGCDKNPGHQKFVPVDQFNVDHLPPGCHDNDLVDFVRALSDLTVRVDVKCVSEKRPKTVEGRPYPYYEDRGSDMMRVGTGWVWEVNKYPDKDNPNHIKCLCQECVNSPTPKIKFAHIGIKTAAHVVFDNLEAAHTTCHLFFDKGGMPDVCSGVITLCGFSAVSGDGVSSGGGGVSGSDVSGDGVSVGGVIGDGVSGDGVIGDGVSGGGFCDLCEMIYVTHDLDLADKLNKMVKRLYNIEKILFKKYGEPYLKRKKQKSAPVKELPDEIKNLTIIVSHPHGCSKQVTVGYHTEECIAEIHSYTASTCPGSSGAPVFVVRKEQMCYGTYLIHSRGQEEDKNLNCSSTYSYYPNYGATFYCFMKS